MSSRRIKSTVAASALLLCAGGYFLSQVLAVQGQGSLAQAPLNVQAQVPPAFVMAVDDSGSMNWEALFKAQDGRGTFGGAGTLVDPYGFFLLDGTNRQNTNPIQADFLEVFPFPGRGEKRQAIPPLPNFGFARAPEVNPAYFNPAEVYPPWANQDGTTMADSPPTAAKVDPRQATGVTFNLTANVLQQGDTSANTYRFRFARQMVVPTGTRYYRDGSSCNFGGTSGQWNTLTAPFTVTGNCTASVEYFPATYYLTTTSSPDGNTDGEPIVQTQGPRTAAGFNTLYRYEIKPANYPSTASYNAAMRNFANWFTYYRSRNLAIVGALTHAFTNVASMRVGYFTINNRVLVTMRDMNIAADRTALYNSFRSLPASGSTPNRFAVEHIGEQFKRTDAGAPVQLACQANGGMLFTDGYSNLGFPAVGNVDGALGAPYQDGFSNTLADVAAKYYVNNLRPGLLAGQVPVPTECTTANPPAGMDCNTDPHMNFYGITLGALGERYGNPPYVDNPLTTVNEATAMAYTVPPVWLNDVDNDLEAVDAIWHGTINGRGEFVNAQTPASVTAAMRRILAATASSATPSGSIALTGSRIGSGSFTVTPSYESRNNSTDWHSTLTAQTVTTNSSGLATFTFAWEAASRLPSSSARNHIWFGTSAGAQPFTAANVGSLANLCNNPQPGQSFCTAAELTALGAPVNPTTLDQAVAYLKGDQTQEVERNPLGKLRFRTSRLGDIVNATPVVSSPIDDYGYKSLPAPYGPSYDTYLTSASGKLNRRALVYAGANDGMLHAFDGRTNSLGGIEVLGYIPQSVVGHTGNLLFPRGPSPQKFQHRYFVDGPIAVSDAYFGGRWETVLVGSTGAGAKGTFGLNVSNLAASGGTFAASDRLWEINSLNTSLPVAVRDNIGHVLGRPVVVPIKTGSGVGPVKWRAIFGNGYNSVSQKAVLYLVDMAVGTVPTVTMIEAIEAAAPTGPNGLGNLVVVDRFGPAADNSLTVRKRDGFADTVYAADQKGAVWKFDLRTATPANLTTPFFTTKLYTSGPEINTRQPIIGGLAAAPGPSGGVMVYFGTGSFSFTTDPGDTSQQSLYAVLDRGTGGTLTRSNLLQQTITGSSPTSRTTSSNAITSGTLGFYVDLPNGERFVGYPRIESGVLFMPTYEASATLGCAAQGNNWLYGLNALSGAAGLSQVRIGSPQGTQPGANTGAVSLATGGSAPVKDIAVLSTPRVQPLGAGATAAQIAAALAQQCTMIVQVAGAPPLFLPRACGRQSWRQVQ